MNPKTPSSQNAQNLGKSAQQPDAPTGLKAMAALVGGSYFPVSALARLPLSMLVIGALTYVVSSASDFATAGAVAAIAGIGVAIGAPLSGAASDRWGQRVALLASSALYVAALLWLLWAGAPREGGLVLDLPLMGAALVAGIVVPQAGPMTRVRWILRLTGRGGDLKTLDAAQGYEATVDEMSFVLGPAAVGIIAAVFGPAVPLWVALALTLVFVPWFALHSSGAIAGPARRGHALHDPDASATAATHDADATTDAATDATTAAATAAAKRAAGVPWALIGVFLLGMLSIGSVFGSLATVSTVFADETGHPGTGGLVYATLGLTSGAAALSVSRWPQRWSPARRWVGCAVVLVPVLALLWLASVPWHLAVVLLLVGAPIGPVLVTIFTAAGARTPSHRLGLVMTLLSAGITLGTSVGNWAGGLMADAGGHRDALWVTFASGVALLLSGIFYALASRKKAARSGN